MRQFILVILFVQCLTNFCAGELSTEKKDLYLNGFIDYLNSLPNQAFAYEDGVILNAEESTDNGYKIEARIKANDLHNLDTFKYVKCTGTVRDAGETEVSVDAYQCQDEEETQTQADIEEEVTNETPLEHEPVKLDNEVQTDTAVTSGEQFVAVPRGQGSAPCIGCASPVNPEAAGVPELASLGVTQLNEYEPNVAHTLNKVVSVERQVQVVNGVRYILTLLVDYNSCSSTVTETCMATKPCKVSVLEKPWVKLPDGSKYRRIVSNNCTNDWIFREHESNSSKNDGDNAGAIDEMVSFVHNKDVQSQPGLDKALTDDDIKKIQEQIISHDHFKQSLANSNDQKVPTEDANTNDFTKQQNFNIESQKTLGKNAEDVVKNSDTVPSNDINLPGSQVVPNGLSTDQKKTIDDLMNFFDFSNFNPKPEDKQNTPRIKRSFDNDLKVFRLAEKFSEIKKTIKNTKYLYTLAEAMVTYLNEIDMEIKNRVVKNVLSAEEESDVTQHFYYLQVLVEIPCQKVQCDNDKLNKICNGVIDTTHETNPQVLNVFCYDMKKNATNWGRMYHVPDSDPILRNMAISALKKIESESPDENALKLIKIINGNTQKVHGILTKITVLIGYTKCKKTENFAKRSNCTVDRDMGTKICDIDVLQRRWLKENKITYVCTERPASESFVDSKKTDTNVNDRSVQEIVQEALQFLEVQSNRNNKQKVVEIKSVSTQLVAGLLTNIDFTVGYTTCTNEFDVDVENCKLIKSEPLRHCQAQVWHRPWLEDGRQMNVSCKNTKTSVPEQDDLPDQELIESLRNKRETNYLNYSERHREKRQIAGGEIEQNPNDPEYLALAEESLQQYIQTTGNTQPHSVTKVDRVRTQVVSGTLTKIDFTVNVGISDVIHCHSRVWEQAWLSKKEITVNCGSDENKLREKRQAPGDRLSGAPIAQDHTLPEYLSLAKTCLKVYLQNKNSTQHHKVIEVKEVTTQVVAGVMTRLTFLVSPTNCQIDNKGVPSAESCEILDKTDVRRCFAKVWDKPWKSERTISVDCKLSRSKREIFADRLKTHNRRLITNMGSEVEQDASKAEYRTLAEESLRKYQRLQKSEVIHTVLEVKRVFTKLVSGTIYKIDFTAQPSKCSKNTLNVSSCSQLHENQTIYCQSEVWDRPWLKRKDIEVDCYTDNHNINEEELNHEEDKEDTPLKGGLLGGSAPQDITAERFKIIANAATRKFESSGKTKYVHKVVKINEATEQIIDGNLVIVKFTVSPTTCLIKDAITDVDKCPIDNNEIKLQCTARVLEQIALEFDEDKMRVSCKRKHQTHIDRQKRSIDVREKRQNRFYDEEIDEETKYYYADKAVQYLNDHSSTHNVQKLITIHSVQNSMHMKVPMVRMYLETAYTYCLRDEHQQDLHLCDELDGMAHRLCLAKLFPAAEDELIVHKVYVVCDDDTDFTKTTGLAISELVAVSVLKLENSPNIKYKLVHQGEPNVAPSLDMKLPVKLHFIVASTNCTKDQDPKRDNVACYIDTTRTAKSCISYIWIVPNEKRISRINVKCNEPSRRKRSLSNDTVSTKSDEARIKQLVQASLEKLEMSSLHRYKQRVLLINSYSTKITTGKVTTIDFDVGYTNCLKYEWIDNITKCEFLEHLPRRHCVSQVWERLWIKNGRNIEVNCEDDETPLESRIEFESAETAMQLAKHSLKHIEAKYPHPKKQQVVRIFSLEKQAVAGMHYRMKLEVGFTNCSALSFESGCTLINDGSMNRFCRVNVWLRTWTNHPPIYRVSCDYQDGTSTELYHHIQAEQLFYNFLTTYKPDYVNDHVEMAKRFDIFKDNIRKIHELNIYELGTATYTVNRFTDLTQEEFSSKYLGLKPSLRDANQVPMPEAKIPKVDVPEAFDWRTYGAVTPVKDQGSCGSCWAFSVTGNIEGQWKIQTGDLVSLSEQELVDCDKLDHGCNGGLPDNAYRAIEELGGLETENDYPYEGEDDKCSYNKTLSRVHISGAVNISSNETEMAQWLVHNGPISIGINANAMQFYRAGISHPWKALCNPDNLDHGVLIVGFGVKDYPLFHKRLPYWIVKNSWGASWGEEGYYRVYRGDGTCGVNKMASSAVV